MGGKPRLGRGLRALLPGASELPVRYVNLPVRIKDLRALSHGECPLHVAAKAVEKLEDLGLLPNIGLIEDPLCE